MTEKTKSAVKIIQYYSEDKVRDFIRKIQRSIDIMIDVVIDRHATAYVLSTTKQKILAVVHTRLGIFLISIDLDDTLADPRKNTDIAKVFERDYAGLILKCFMNTIKKEKVWKRIEDYFTEKKKTTYLFRLQNLLYYVKILLAIVRKSRDELVNALKEVTDDKYQIFEDFAKNDAFVGIFSEDEKLSTLIALLYTRISFDIGMVEKLLRCDDKCLRELLQNSDVDDTIISMQIKLLELQLNS